MELLVGWVGPERARWGVHPGNVLCVSGSWVGTTNWYPMHFQNPQGQERPSGCGEHGVMDRLRPSPGWLCSVRFSGQRSCVLGAAGVRLAGSRADLDADQGGYQQGQRGTHQRGVRGDVPGFPGAKVGCVNVSRKTGIHPSEQNHQILTPSSGAREGVCQRLREEARRGAGGHMGSSWDDLPFSLPGALIHQGQEQVWGEGLDVQDGKEKTNATSSQAGSPAACPLCAREGCGWTKE